jgi:filamentous hemagglutinin
LQCKLVKTSKSKAQAWSATANTGFAAKSAVNAVVAGQGTTINGKDNQIATKVDDNGKVIESRDATAADKVGGINISVSLGSSKSQSSSQQSTDSARASTVAADNNVSINAVGAGQSSDLTAQGAIITAGNTVALNADGKINLQAAQNTASQTSSNSSSSGSIGISFGIGGANSGLAVTASASKARGNADGNDVTWINTQVSAGNQVTLNSGGDTTIKGAVVAANQVTAKVGGNFAIESPQDTSQYTSQQKSVGGSITAGFDGKVSGSINASKSNIKSDFASVGEQSGIKAGDAGFKVDIANNADLKGGAITSTDKAVQDGKNTFKQGGTLSTSDIQNKADYSASSVGANFGTGFDAAGKLTPQGTSAGIGSDSGNAASTTKAGISGIAGNKDARTTDAQTGIAKIFDASKVQKDIDAQTQITQRFGLEASKAIGDYAATQLQTAKTLRDQAAKESDPTKAQALQSQAQALEKNWGEQGTLRVLAHTAVGGLTGGVSGAAGAATGTLIAPMVAEQLAKAGITGSLAQTLVATASTAAGAAVGGKAGAAAGLNEVANNYLSHPERNLLNQKQKECLTSGSASACSAANALITKDQLSDKLLANAVATCSGNECNNVVNFIGKEIAAQGCTSPSACPDTATLNKYWSIAQEKAQGLEPVYPEAWLLDVKGVLDLGKFGVKLLTSGGTGAKGSLYALAQLGKTDATLSEANFTVRLSGLDGAKGGVAATDGLAFRTDLPSHMIGPDGFTKSGQLSGTHNLTNATSSLDTVGAAYKLKPTGTAGVYELSYTYTNPATGKVVSGSKTVYDPAVFSDQTMINNAQQAGQQAWTQYLKNPTVKVIDGSVGGVNFRSYINVDKNGNAFISNVHPIK